MGAVVALAHRGLLIFVVGGCLLALSGCAKLHAKSAPAAPPLDVPAAPAHVVETIDSEPPPPATLPKEPARHTPPPQSTRPANTPPRPDPAKQEPPKPEQAPPPEPPKVEEPPKPATTLQTTPVEQEGEAERTIRGVLARASNDLSHIDYGKLTQEARTQYDTAKRFVTQAEEALNAKNLMFARTVADKAAALAAQLARK
jgi:hypothetical protein